MLHNRFKTSFSENIWKQKYSQGTNDSWDALAERVVEDVCGTRWGKDHALMSDGDRTQLAEYIKEMKFVPGGRYIFYSGRPNSFYPSINQVVHSINIHSTRVIWRVLCFLFLIPK